MLKEVLEKKETAGEGAHGSALQVAELQGEIK